MFYDEDGDLAHEFYEEVKINDLQTAMRRRLVNLHPQVNRTLKTYFQVDTCIICSSHFQGTVYYPNPRLHVDFPIPMYSPLEK